MSYINFEHTKTGKVYSVDFVVFSDNNSLSKIKYRILESSFIPMALAEDTFKTNDEWIQGISRIITAENEEYETNESSPEPIEEYNAAETEEPAETVVNEVEDGK